MTYEVNGVTFDDNDVAVALGGSFDWFESEQGYEYWEGVCSRFRTVDKTDLAEVLTAFTAFIGKLYEAYDVDEGADTKERFANDVLSKALTPEEFANYMCEINKKTKTIH